MRAHVDHSLCQGYGNCVMEAPEVFELDEHGLSIVIKENIDDPGEQARVRTAVELCPMSAISITEDDGAAGDRA